MKGKLSLLSSALFAQRVFLVLGLKMENVTVAQWGVKDGEASLKCDYNLESDTLQSLKWYKDGHEFFRYTPGPQPNILTFAVNGVSIDLTKTNKNHVELKNISLSSGGTYKCEVSADRPSFQTLSKQGTMIVIAPPKSDPEITGVHSMLSAGDLLIANCTCFRTKPLASLMFYINDEKQEEGVTDLSPKEDADGLLTAVLGLNIQLEPRHFKNEKLELKCSATIGNSYRVTVKRVTETKINAQPSGHNHNRLAGTGDARRLSECNPTIVTILQFLQFCFIYHNYKYN